MNENDPDYLGSRQSLTYDIDKLYENGKINAISYYKYRLHAKCQDTFKCTRCGKCCTEMDAVELSMDDIKPISKSLGMNSQQFIRKYRLERASYKEIGTFYRLTWKHGESCPFYSSNACSIYEIRPDVCKKYPFLTPEGLEKTKKMDSLWFYGAQCEASVKHAAEMCRTLGLRAPEPDQETKERMKREKSSEVNLQ